MAHFLRYSQHTLHSAREYICSECLKNNKAQLICWKTGGVAPRLRKAGLEIGLDLDTTCHGSGFYGIHFDFKLVLRSLRLVAACFWSYGSVLRPCDWAEAIPLSSPSLYMPLPRVWICLQVWVDRPTPPLTKPYRKLLLGLPPFVGIETYRRTLKAGN